MFAGLGSRLNNGADKFKCNMFKLTANTVLCKTVVQLNSEIGGASKVFVGKLFNNN